MNLLIEDKLYAKMHNKNKCKLYSKIFLLNGKKIVIFLKFYKFSPQTHI